MRADGVRAGRGGETAEFLAGLIAICPCRPGEILARMPTCLGVYASEPTVKVRLKVYVKIVTLFPRPLRSDSQSSKKKVRGETTARLTISSAGSCASPLNRERLTMKGFVLCSALLLTTISASAQQPVKGLKQGVTVELAGGFARTQFDNSGGYPNMNGFFGSVGVNILPWLQIQADASAQYGSLTGATTNIYGNHFGPRVLYRPFHSTTFTTFGEFLAGGSRLDLNVNGPGGSKFSENGFSFKAGGGVDWHISRHWSVRVFDADYYRTSFLQTHQNNLWISTGIVFTLGRNRTPH
jgi:hypothetical protein